MTTPTQGEHAQTEALLPCPFCGASAHFETDGDGWHWIECESCGMQGNRSASLMEDCKPKLREAWNTRAGVHPDVASGYAKGWEDGMSEATALLTLAQPAAPQGVAYAELPALFREALAWGMTYGPAIPAHQWDEMRESMVKVYAKRASHGQAPAVTAGDREKWEQQVNDLIDEYGDELATEACHGEIHCRQSPARIREQIRVLLSAPTAQPAPAAPFSRETQDQIAAVMLQHGTEDQQRAALAYASVPAPAATPQADSQPAPQGETNAQLDTDSNSSAPGQQRDVAGTVALGQPVGHGSDSTAGDASAQGDKLLTVAERNIRSFLRSATFKSESDREAALSCVDVLWTAARAPVDSVTTPAAGAVAGPSVFGLQWPDDKRINLSTIFDTEYEANKFILERCSTPGIRVVRLSEHPTPAAQADSVLEDAARLDWLQHNGATVEIMQGRPNFDWCFRVAGLHATTRNSIREAIDAARKQGGKHD